MSKLKLHCFPKQIPCYLDDVVWLWQVNLSYIHVSFKRILNLNMQTEYENTWKPIKIQNCNFLKFKLYLKKMFFIFGWCQEGRLRGTVVLKPNLVFLK